MRGTWVALLLAGCMNHTYDNRPGPGSGSGSDPLPVDHADPHSCQENTTLVGMPSSTISQSFALAADSIGWCLTLDATQNIHEAHLGADTPNITGDSSGIRFALLDASTTDDLIDGWDLTFGDSDPQTHATLEWSVPAGQTQTVILRARSLAPRRDTITLQLFEPFE